jgi:hypothetical protein
MLPLCVFDVRSIFVNLGPFLLFLVPLTPRPSDAGFKTQAPGREGDPRPRPAASGQSHAVGFSTVSPSKEGEGCFLCSAVAVLLSLCRFCRLCALRPCELPSAKLSDWLSAAALTRHSQYRRLCKRLSNVVSCMIAVFNIFACPRQA